MPILDEIELQGLREALDDEYRAFATYDQDDLGPERPFASAHEACEAGVEAEVANASLYERLLRSTTREDLVAVYRALQRASQERHLPAFRRGCARGVDELAV